jgi:putative transposase
MEVLMSQSLSNILIHVVFSTKKRVPFLRDPDIRGRLHAYITTVFAALDSPSLECGGTADHIHILCALGRNHAVAEVLNKVKSASSNWVKRFGSMLTKFEWQRGYGAFSTHPSLVPALRDYIRNQEEHHKVRTFQEEYLALLKEHNVSYDDSYLWT